MIVYGLGSTGRRIVDELLDAGVDIELILDRGKSGEEHRGIPVLALDELAERRIAGKTALITLHNHYVDLQEVDAALRTQGIAEVLTPIHLGQLLDQPRSQAGYWLEPEFDYAARRPHFERVRQLLADDKSRDLFDAILLYRQGGQIADCPIPSLHDEYTPADLPRYAEPLRLADCGAFTGVAIHKFLKAGYAIDSVVAFEPDPFSFATLAKRSFPVGKTLCLPLGTWSSTRQLSFAGDSSMASHLSDQGDVTIQCVALDDVLQGEPINLVKLDVEGAEVETLKGMERLAREQRPHLLVSAYHTAGHLHEIAELIDDWGLGYRFHLRVHEQNTFGIVLYALQPRLLAG